jgi:hypothetical protein
VALTPLPTLEPLTLEEYERSTRAEYRARFGAKAGDDYAEMDLILERRRRQLEAPGTRARGLQRRPSLTVIEGGATDGR